ncbi:MAG: polyprenyl synthetase family protein [Anaerolineae bacterium]|nr:MAG: polyprenyl synthetase family protein [Anaerolineae bacterium]
MNHPLMQTMLVAIERRLQADVTRLDDDGTYAGLQSMIRYHMGWEGEGAGPKARGKRIRPLLVLLTAAAAGGDWEDALPAASAVELVHNFSLLHDDIEDNSPLRRGRPTVWKKWGVAQALNAGDALFSLAHLIVLDLQHVLPPAAAMEAARLLQQTCLRLTRGQYLDISYEERLDLTLADYWPMVSGKTAALLAACTELGALVAAAPADVRQHYHRFGNDLGLAFQALDDYLGIWGDAALTGKSTHSDLLAGKKSLPVLYGLEQNGAFAARWRQGNITAAEVPALAEQLTAEGGREYTLKQAERLTASALDALRAAHPQGEAGEALEELARALLRRQV